MSGSGEPKAPSPLQTSAAGGQKGNCWRRANEAQQHPKYFSRNQCKGLFLSLEKGKGKREGKREVKANEKERGEGDEGEREGDSELPVRPV